MSIKDLLDLDINFKKQFKEIFLKASFFFKEILITGFLLVGIGVCINAYYTAIFLSWTFLSVATVLIFLLWKQQIYNFKKRENEINLIPSALDNDSKSLFSSEKEILMEEEDRLEYRESANKFSEHVVNNYEKDSIIFGLDAPWGSGKTSYINLCKRIWKNDPKLLVFSFKPILFDSRKQDLVSIFIEELILELRSHNINVNDLESNLKKLLKKIKGISMGGISIDTLFLAESSDILLRKIKTKLNNLDRKVIIIIDDLDRLYLEDIKAILGIIRNVFYTDNMTFILCYDSNCVNTFETEYKNTHTYTFPDKRSSKVEEGQMNRSLDYKYSRAQQDLDNSKINAYLEKFVQVKKLIIPTRENLLDYFIFLVKGVNVDPNSPSFIRLRDGITELFKEENYWLYQPLLGDIRKIKRIFNVLHATGLVSIDDYQDRDINFVYLLQLILIYVNHPHIFQKIYASETGDAYGFFSVIHNYVYRAGSSTSEEPYKNSEKFINYIKTLSEQESFLLHKLFCVECALGHCKRREWAIENTLLPLFKEDSFLESSPMFNGGGAPYKNLEDYLKIIYKQELLPKHRYNAFHQNRINELETKSVEEIFSTNPEYALDQLEEGRRGFFKGVENKIITFEAANKVIEYIPNNLHKYSSLDDFSGPYNGLRDSLVYKLAHLIDTRGWEEGPFENEESKIAVLALRVLGKDKYAGNSVFDKLLNFSSDQHPILSVVDSTLFIYSCSSDSNFNLRRSIDKYEKDNNVDVRQILSVKAFSFFEGIYISKRVNFLEEIYSMDDNFILGEYSSFIKNYFQEEKADLSEEIQKVKTGLMTALIFRFGKNDPESMGEYLFPKKLPLKIFEIMREYLFDVCFHVTEEEPSNSKFFIDYILASKNHDRRNNNYGWNIDIKKVEASLGERLKLYWEANHLLIKQYFQNSEISLETKVCTNNYITSYSEDLENAFIALDQHFQISEQ